MIAELQVIGTFRAFCSCAASMRYVVLGGGIAGVSCGKELARLTVDEQDVEVFIITATHLLKEVSDH